MKTFEEAIKRFYSLPKSKDGSEILSWIRTVNSSELGVRFMDFQKNAFLADMVRATTDDELENVIRRFTIELFIFGMMVGIDMEKPEVGEAQAKTR